MSLNNEDMTTSSDGEEGLADGGATVGATDGGADGGAGSEGPAVRALVLPREVLLDRLGVSGVDRLGPLPPGVRVPVPEPLHL